MNKIQHKLNIIFFGVLIFIGCDSKQNPNSNITEIKKEKVELTTIECQQFVELHSVIFWANDLGQSADYVRSNFKINTFEKESADGKGAYVGELLPGTRALIIEEGISDYKVKSPYDQTIGWISKIQVASTIYQNINTFESCIPEKPKIEVSPTEKIVVEKTYALDINTIEDFKNSFIYDNYSMKPSMDWDLKNGNHYFSIDITKIPNISLGVEAKNGVIKDFGVTIYDKYNGLSSREFDFIEDLLKTIFDKTDINRVSDFIKENIETDLFQIYDGKSLVVGKYKIWAGKVIQQTIIIENQ